MQITNDFKCIIVYVYYTLYNYIYCIYKAIVFIKYNFMYIHNIFNNIETKMFCTISLIFHQLDCVMLYYKNFKFLDNFLFNNIMPIYINITLYILHN